MITRHHLVARTTVALVCALWLVAPATRGATVKFYSDDPLSREP